MTEAHAPEDAYWRKELQAFQAYAAAHAPATYRDWQPTKWQSLLRISRLLTARYGPGRALELGCGSGTLLLQLAAAGWRCTGVDWSPSAIALAKAGGASLGIDAALAVQDFHALPKTGHDLVFSIGVIEHLDEEGQLALLDLHFRHASRGVLIGIPNLDSPIFQSFLAWARREGREYERDHRPIDVPRLARRLGRRVAVEDGAHLFLSRREYFTPGNPELDRFYAAIGARLAAEGGGAYASFPAIDFAADDIDLLDRVERQATVAERLRFGFLTYYVLE